MEMSIRERIDREVETSEWLQLFPECSLGHLSHSFSNHCPLLIQTEYEGLRRRNSRFRFEAW